MPSTDPTGYPYPCGGSGEPACPPQPTLDAPTYSYSDMLAHGAAQYAKGRLDALTEFSSRSKAAPHPEDL